MTEERTVWVNTEPTLEGDGYVVTLSCGDDDARVLDPAEAMLHAQGVFAAVALAEYDAAVARQLTARLDVDGRTKGKTSLMATSQIVADLRADRPPLDPKATAPLQLDPGVNREFEPFLTVNIHGERVGQWTMEDARGHALGILMAVTNADLDAAYLRVLMGGVKLDRATAQQVVNDLSNYWVDYPVGVDE